MGEDSKGCIGAVIRIAARFPVLDSSKELFEASIILGKVDVVPG